LTSQPFIPIFNKPISPADENLAKRILLFLSHTIIFPAFQEIPGAVDILVCVVQYRERIFHEIFWS
jgi:hypothetical protein